MSREEEDLREFARVLEELAREAKTLSDLKSKLLSDASARLDDISAKRTVEDREARSQRSRGLPRKVIRYLATQWEALQHGPALSDPLARGVVEGLVENGRITGKQRRLINHLPDDPLSSVWKHERRFAEQKFIQAGCAGAVSPGDPAAAFCCHRLGGCISARRGLAYRLYDWDIDRFSASQCIRFCLGQRRDCVLLT